MFHGIKSKRPRKGEVAGRIHLLHKARLLGPRPNPSKTGQGPQHLLHDELAGKGEEDGVEAQEGKVPRALSVLPAIKPVGKEDKTVDDIGLGWVAGVNPEEAENES
jgi:hypothetical protein